MCTYKKPSVFQKLLPSEPDRSDTFPCASKRAVGINPLPNTLTVVLLFQTLSGWYITWQENTLPSSIILVGKIFRALFKPRQTLCLYGTLLFLYTAGQEGSLVTSSSFLPFSSCEKSDPHNV